MIKIKNNVVNLIEYTKTLFEFTGNKENIIYPDSDRFNEIREFIIYGYNANSLTNKFSYNTLVFVDCYEKLKFHDNTPIEHYISELLAKHCTLVFIDKCFNKYDFSKLPHVKHVVDEDKPSFISFILNKQPKSITIEIPYKQKYLQDFLCHIHPPFCGHEFVDLDYINKFSRENNMPIVVTPHFELNECRAEILDYNHVFNDKIIRNNTLKQIDYYSNINPNIIPGAEFTIQTMMDFESYQIPSEWITIASYHDMFKYNGYSYKSDGSIDKETTLNNRPNHNWYYTGKKTADELLEILRQVLDEHYIHIIGHLERDIPNMLINPTPEEQEKLLIGTLDLAEEYNIAIEVNYAKTSIEEKRRLIKLALERGLKLVVGLDAHTNEQVSLEHFYEILNLIPIENQVTLDELKSKHNHTWC